MEIKRIHDIVEENGKTIRGNNLEKIHNIAIGTLVEVTDADGKADKVRLYVNVHRRDSDGTPLYSLGLKDNVDISNMYHGYPESCLIVV